MMGSGDLSEDVPVILVIEDEEAIQSLVEDALSEGGFEPAIAASGEEAVTLLKGRTGNYRALVTDITLRGRIDGWEVAKQAREIDPKRRQALLHEIQRLAHERVMHAPLWELGFLNAIGPRVEESGLGLIALHPYSAPYEDVRLKK